MICWLAKAAGVEASGQMRDEQLHAVAAQSTFGSQNVQTIPGPDHCWKLRCRKSARRCGAKHIYTPCLDHFSKLRCRKWTPLWREAHFQVKTRQLQTAVLARSTFGSQNVQSTPCSDHFLILRCRKSARRCGAKHISRSKCTKHVSFGPLLEVAMSKKCTLLWPKHIWKSVVHGCRAHVLQRKCAGCDSACSQSAEYIL